MFSLAGIVSPTVLLRGEIAAKWQRKGKTLLVQPFRPLQPAERDALQEEAERLWPQHRLRLEE